VKYASLLDRLPEADRKELNRASALDQRVVSLNQKGRSKEAVPLARKAAEIRQRLLTEDHPHYADSLNNLAMLYQAMGDYRNALPLLKQARDLTKKLLTADHPNYATSLNNLAMLYQAMGDYRRALPLFQQARDLRKRLLTEDHPDYATSLNNLASLYKAMGDYRSALSLYQQAGHLLKKLLTEDHPHYTQSLSNLAGVYEARGDYRRALPLYQQARDLIKKLLTEDHPHYAQSLNNLAVILHCLGKAREGLPLTRKSLAIDKRHVDDTFAALSDRQRLDFTKDHRYSLFLFLTLAQAVDSPATEVYPHVLAAKGILAARQAEEQLARDQPKLKPRLDELRQVCASLAKVSRQTPATKEQQQDWRKRFDDLEKEKEKLEVLLARKSETFRRFQKLRDATAKDVADALPAKTAFIDFLFYSHSTPPPEKKGKMRAETRLLAFVLSRGQAPVMVALGATGPIERAVAGWRQAVVKGQSPDRPGQALHRRLWVPLRKHLRGVDAVLIAPDGALSSLAFAALPGSKPGSYLGEELAIGYVTSGRQLLELQADQDAPRGQGLLTVGDLAYGKPAAKPPASAGFAPLDFAPLPGTGVEVQRIARLYRQAFPKASAARQLAGTTADAPQLKAELPPTAKASPRYLHLATHAFFEAPPPAIKTKGKTASADQERQDRLLRRNPLLLSGLVLSGANESYQKGILTAEEVSSLDLRGVELAVLSACQTGLGRVDPGEGVLGLQRGFQRAGARSMAVSLWSVNDAATSVLMEEFYTNLWVKKLSKLKALRQAQLAVLRNPQLVIKRNKELAEQLAKRGFSEEELAERGIKKKAGTLPGGGQVRDRSPVAWWAAFVLYGDGR
jgi:CHAT domain-containing protein